MAPVGASIRFQYSSPSKMRAYSRSNMSLRTDSRTTAATSSGAGQRSFRCTAFPSRSAPSGSSVRSMSTVPASAYATTRGGEAR